MSLINTFNSLSVNGWQSNETNSFILETTLTITPAQTNAFLSTSLAINYVGNVIIAGAPNYDITVGNTTYSNSGAVAVYSGAGNVWTQNQILYGNNISNNDVQGYEIAISGDGQYIAMSSSAGINPNATSQGSVYVFKDNGSSYVQQTQVFGSNGNTSSTFSSSISLNENGDYMCVGASDEDNVNLNNGAAYIFQRTSNTWTQQQRIIASDANINIGFGVSNDIDPSGNYVIVGATGYDGANTNSGAAYIFGRTGNTWTQLQKLEPSAPVIDNQFFGHKVKISNNGNVVAVAGPTDAVDGPPNGGGSVWIYSKSGNTWSEIQRINIVSPVSYSPPSAYSLFGYALDMDKEGNWLVISNPVKPMTYTFYKSGNTFALIQGLNQNNLPNDKDYAYQVACSDEANYVLINIPGAIVSNIGQGKFEIYKKT